MPLTFLKGDLFEMATTRTGVRGLAFAADVSGKLDTGFAHAVGKKWPAFAKALAEHAADGKAQLGDVFAYREGDLVLYALGLSKEGSKPRISTLERALATVFEQAPAEGVTALLLPRIGGGKSGLDYTRVKRVLEESAKSATFDVLVFEQFVRTAAG